MSVVTPTKIFVDPREEITFIIERILNADKDKVIVVIPHNSTILSSIISLKILNQRLANSSKLAILVIEDEYGINIASKIGLVAVAHVSDVTGELWNKAEQLKSDIVSAIQDRKEALVTEWKNVGEDTEISKDQKAESLKDVEGDSVENEKKKTENTKITKEHEKSLDLSSLTSNQDDHTAKSDVSKNLLAEEKDYDEEVLKKELQKYQKPKLEAKEVTVDGITILAGGDVRALQSKSENDTISPELISNMKNNKKEEVGNRPTREVTSFTGKDFTKQVKTSKGLFNNLPSFFSFQPKKSREISDPAEVARKKQRRRIIAGGIAVLILFIVGFSWFYITSVFSSVDVDITFTTEDVAFNEKIVASDTITEVNPDTLEVPALLLIEENLNTSLTGTATGQGSRGEKAAGFVTFSNIDIETEVIIPEGTRITNVLNDLVFLLQEEVRIDAVTFDELDTIVVPESVDAVIEAENPGEEYNFEGDDAPTSFLAQGFDSDSLQITRFTPFEGGTSESFTAVAESDVSSLEDEARSALLEEGTSKLRAFVPNGYILLEETIEFQEDEVRPFPAVGEEAEDGTFSFNISGSVSALAVRSEDLQDITQQVLSAQGTEIPSLEDFEANLTDVVRDGNRVAFNVDSTALFANQKTNDELIDLIKGKSLDDAVRTLSDLEETEDVSITYSPGFVPSNFQRVPNDEGRISITIN